MKIEMRMATLQDAETLASFGAETFRYGCPPGTAEEDLAAFIASELTPEQFRRYLSNVDVTIYVAEAEGKMAGYLMVVRGSRHEQVKAERQHEIRKLYVHPQFHGHGVAHELMRVALRQIETDDVWLGVFSGNTRALAFYRKWGFEVIGRQIFMVGRDAQQDFVMQRMRK